MSGLLAVGGSGVAQAAPASAGTASINLDWNGDGHADLLVVNNLDGNLYSYDGNGNNVSGQGFADLLGTRIGTAWSGLRNVIRVSNWPGESGETVVAVRSDGELLGYPTDGHGRFLGPIFDIGARWNQFSIVVGATNFAGDGLPDVLGMLPNGDLYLWEFGPSGWVKPNGQLIGCGFNVFDQIVAMRWTTNGHLGLLGHTSGGALRFYEGDGAGGFATITGVQIGSGFVGAFGPPFQLVSVGDWNGDGMADLLTVDGAGDLSLYEGNGTGGWLSPTGSMSGTGFKPMRVF
ncbi:MAG TPA: hypothetical protein VEO01_37240 [Pseudonocardiaceae bacterium]|nr:hypothetical protein [Pseudonocardiaceae bacterium]